MDDGMKACDEQNHTFALIAACHAGKCMQRGWSRERSSNTGVTVLCQAW